LPQSGFLNIVGAAAAPRQRTIAAIQAPWPNTRHARFPEIAKGLPSSGL